MESERHESSCGWFMLGATTAGKAARSRIGARQGDQEEPESGAVTPCLWGRVNGCTRVSRHVPQHGTVTPGKEKPGGRREGG